MPRILLCLFCLLVSAIPMRADPALWAAISSGEAVAMMRHAIAPGTGDPADFAIGNCSTQRNLDERGRAQARAIGDRFRDNNIKTAEIFTSQWCRCRDTAELLDLGSPADLPALNSFFANRSLGPEQTRALQDFLAARTPGVSMVLVTHQVNITALTGVVPQSGEIVVIAGDGSGAVLGRISP